MNANQHLLLSLRGSLYAIDVAAISEILPLPELTHIEEAPPEYVGVVNRRGHVLPVIDLSIKFGQPTQPYQLSDCLVILENLGNEIGILVSEALEVCELQIGDIVPISNFDWKIEAEQAVAHTQFIQGLAKHGDKLLMVIDLPHLFHYSSVPMEGRGGTAFRPNEVLSPPKFGTSFEEQIVFSERCRKLSEPMEMATEEGDSRMAVVRIGVELFGIELESIREFAEVGVVAPVPCCPSHVVGQMNLRGDLITVVDVSTVLGINPTEQATARKLVVLNGVELAAGVLVDELIDVIHFEKQHAFTATTANSEAGVDHLLGLTQYKSKVVSRVDLPALLTNGSLVVNEKP